MTAAMRRAVLRDPVCLLGVGAGAGLVPIAPGTAGSALALLPAWALLSAPLALRISVVLAVFAAGIWICGVTARRLGRHDHPAIVWDEIAGQLATTLVLGANPWWLLPAFVLFRFFDIAKPWPIRDLDHSLGGGLGIMLDDMMAAAYAAVALYAIHMAIPIS